MANISSINGNPIVVGTNGISDGAVTGDKIASDVVGSTSVPMVEYLKVQFVNGSADPQPAVKAAKYYVYGLDRVYISGTVGGYQDKYDFTATDETEITSYERNFSPNPLTMDNYEVEVPSGAKFMYVTATKISILQAFRVIGIAKRMERLEAAALPTYAVFVGDSYTQAGNLGTDQYRRFATILCQRMKLVEINYAVGGMGYVTGTTPFITQLQNAIADTTYDHDLVGYVFICGNRNDDGSKMEPMLPDADYVSAVQEVITTAKAEYTNAKVIVRPSMNVWHNRSAAGNRAYENVIYAARSLDCFVIPNAYSWLVGMRDYTLKDNVHPTVEGHAIIASHILDALTTGHTFAYPDRVVLTANSTYVASGGVFGLVQMNNEVIPVATFTTTGAIPAGSTLFELAVNDSRNIPCYCDNRNFISYNSGAGTIVLLVLRMEYTDTGYVIRVTNQTAVGGVAALAVRDQHFTFGLNTYVAS